MLLLAFLFYTLFMRHGFSLKISGLSEFRALESFISVFTQTFPTSIFVWITCGKIASFAKFLSCLFIRNFRLPQLQATTLEYSNTRILQSSCTFVPHKPEKSTAYTDKHYMYAGVPDISSQYPGFLVFNFSLVNKFFSPYFNTSNLG